MENKEFWIQYENNDPKVIETHWTGEKTRKKPLTNVGDLIVAYRSAVVPILIDHVSLHSMSDRPSLAERIPLSSIQEPFGSYDHPLIMKFKDDDSRQGIAYGRVWLNMKMEHFRLTHPPSMPVSLFNPLRKLDCLLGNEAFLNTFALLGLPEDKFERLLTNEQLTIHIAGSVHYNNWNVASRKEFGEDVRCDKALGWFDSRVHPSTAFINYDYCTTDGSNNHWAEMLILITAIHELCHYLFYHSDMNPPTHSFFGEERAEAGECWEIQNLGGIVKHAAHTDSPLFVQGLHMYTESGDFFLTPSSIDQLDRIVNSQQTFPVSLDTTNKNIAGLEKCEAERHCIESAENRPFIPYTEPPFRRCRKGPRRFQETHE